MLTIVARVDGREIRDTMAYHWGVRPRDCLIRLLNQGLIAVRQDPLWCASLPFEDARHRVLLRAPQPLPLDKFIPRDNLVIEMSWAAGPSR
ncbi:hypothetical protein C4552_02565 [Candidatus Parcubacteria bacterium]|nr:MAG: hypothetical protein C4552_02565 [Candidatus Parcubacteria bacterium]